MDRSGKAVLSPEGAVVTPQAIRDRLGLEAGTEFHLVGEGDLVVLEVVGRSGQSGLVVLLEEGRRSADAAGLTPADVEAALRWVRAEPAE